jgi:hypothetical protein
VKNIVPTLGLLAVLLLASACSRSIETKGEMFVVTEGQASIKLAMVNVSVFSENALKEYLPSKNAEIVELKQKYSDASAAASRASSAIDKNATQQFIARAGAVESQEAIYDAAADARAKYTNIRAETTRQKIMYRYAKGLPMPTVKVQTDSEGKFSVKFPKPGKYAVYAMSDRLTLSDREFYGWFFWVDVKNAEQKITLNNGNQIDMISPNQVIPAIGIY